MLGERVAGKYQLKRLLGSGSMGAVYEGVHVDIGKRLAIKLIHPEFGDSPEVVGRFRREARAASAVESDYIVQIYDFGRDDALGLYMVIEYLEGEDLEARLVRERWIGERDAVTIGVQVARGLAKAHAAGIIHRDLKPANVFLTERDEDGSILAKILDFGISKFDSDAAPASQIEPTLTAHGTTLGTPQYMSPEQCEGKVALDGRTDVWSLSAVLYEMLAGEPAVTDDGGHIGMMMRIVREDVVPLRKRASWVNETLAGAIDVGLVRDRDKRISSAMALMARLIEAFPEAGSRLSMPSIQHIQPKTDISELAPKTPRSDRDPSTPSVDVDMDSDLPPVTIAEPPRATIPEAARGLVVPIKLADTGNPATAKPPSSAEPPSSNDDSVAIFVRGDEMPKELLALRQKNKSKGD
jgi:eukaryotic-like serine/threonine-protein kinase